VLLPSAMPRSGVPTSPPGVRPLAAETGIAARTGVDAVAPSEDRDLAGADCGADCGCCWWAGTGEGRLWCWWWRWAEDFHGSGAGSP
jgi:hypothetical protein